MDGDRADLIVDLVDNIEQIPNMRELTSLLALQDSAPGKSPAPI
jgi:hypothetical protein